MASKNDMLLIFLKNSNMQLTFIKYLIAIYLLSHLILTKTLMQLLWWIPLKATGFSNLPRVTRQVEELELDPGNLAQRTQMLPGKKSSNIKLFNLQLSNYFL